MKHHRDYLKNKPKETTNNDFFDYLTFEASTTKQIKPHEQITLPANNQFMNQIWLLC